MSGWELSRSIRERDNQLPLAVITGWGDVVGSDEQKAAQIDWVVTKPFAMNRITDIIHHIAERKKDSGQRQLDTFAA